MMSGSATTATPMMLIPTRSAAAGATAGSCPAVNDENPEEKRGHGCKGAATLLAPMRGRDVDAKQDNIPGLDIGEDPIGDVREGIEKATDRCEQHALQHRLRARTNEPM